jgi:hypothetical protein
LAVERNTGSAMTTFWRTTGFYTGTQGETLDTAKELPTDDRASSRPYHARMSERDATK